MFHGNGERLRPRLAEDDSGKMNRNIRELRGGILVVSQFTLYGDARKGRRPSFDRAASPERARELYEYFLSTARQGPVPVQAGEFQAMMEVRLVNDGPVTIWMDSAERRSRLLRSFGSNLKRLRILASSTYRKISDQHRAL